MARAPKYEKQTATLDDVVSGGFSDLEELGQEMQDWFDNMPENLQGGSKGDEVSSAADALGNISSVDVPASLVAVNVEYTFNAKARSRSDRRDNAVSMLVAAIEKTQELRDAESEKPEGERRDELVDEYDEFIGELENARDEAEGVDFPGMY